MLGEGGGLRDAESYSTDIRDRARRKLLCSVLGILLGMVSFRGEIRAEMCRSGAIDSGVGFMGGRSFGKGCVCGSAMLFSSSR